MEKMIGFLFGKNGLMTGAVGWLMGFFRSDYEKYDVEKPRRSSYRLIVPEIVASGCVHQSHLEAGPFEVECLNRIFTIEASIACPKCTADWLKKVCGVCPACGGVIMPGDVVAEARPDEIHRYTHFSFPCFEGEIDGVEKYIWGDDGKTQTIH